MAAVLGADIPEEEAVQHGSNIVDEPTVSAALGDADLVSSSASTDFIVAVGDDVVTPVAAVYLSTETKRRDGISPAAPADSAIVAIAYDLVVAASPMDAHLVTEVDHGVVPGASADPKPLGSPFTHHDLVLPSTRVDDHVFGLLLGEDHLPAVDPDTDVVSPPVDRDLVVLVRAVEVVVPLGVFFVGGHLTTRGHGATALVH